MPAGCRSAARRDRGRRCRRLALTPRYLQGGPMRKKLVWIVVVLGLLTATALTVTGGGAAKSQAAFKVAWIYPGPHNDHGWSQAHDAGRLYVQKMLGSAVQTTYKENIFSNA